MKWKKQKFTDTFSDHDAPYENEVELWGVGTGRVVPWMRASRQAVDFIRTLEGFVGVHPTEDGEHTVWLFNSKNNAIRAMNLMRAEGIETGEGVGKVFAVKE